MRKQLALVLLAAMGVGVNLREALASGPAPAAVDWNAIEAEALHLLQDYVRIDTSNPPGDVNRAVDYLEGVLRREGIATKRFVTDAGSGRTSLLAKLPGSGQGRPILLLSHLDVVPADPARWRVPPFSATLLEGEVWGRGTLDMKSLGVIELMTMLTLKRQGFVPARDMLVLFDPDEEVGGAKGAQWMTEHAWSDLDPEYVLDEGGSGTRSVYTTDGRTIFGVSVEEKQVLWLRLVAYGESTHASRPGPHNAVSRLCQAIAKLPSSIVPDREALLVTEMKRRLGGELADNPMTRALAVTTVTPTTLRAGVGEPPKVNVIPGRAEAQVDCRLLPGESVPALVARIKALVADSVTQVEVIQLPGERATPAWDTPMFHAIERAVTRHVPGAVTMPVLFTGGTDARFFRAKGVSSYGFLPYVLTGEQLALWHSDNERLVLAEFYRGLRIYHSLLTDILALPPDR